VYLVHFFVTYIIVTFRSFTLLSKEMGLVVGLENVLVVLLVSSVAYFHTTIDQSDRSPSHARVSNLIDLVYFDAILN